MSSIRRKEQFGSCTLILGDSREVLKETRPAAASVMITDPVWPNAPDGMFPGCEKPAQLLRQVLMAGHYVDRVSIVMRYDSDVRFLKSVPAHWPFFRVCCLPYVLPSRIGRTLGGMEMLYSFGTPIKSEKGRHIVPGMGPSVQPNSNERNGHPCPRTMPHMNWVVNWFSDRHEIIIDPFMGSGTTGEACVRHGRAFIGIEIEEKYFDIACRRIEKSLRQTELFVEQKKPREADAGLWLKKELPHRRKKIQQEIGAMP